MTRFLFIFSFAFFRCLFASDALERPYDVIAIGDAVNNVFLSCSDLGVCRSLMQGMDLHYNGQISIGKEYRDYLEAQIQGSASRISTQTEFAVGSVSNSVRIIAALGGKTAFIGRVGSDPQGISTEKTLRQSGVIPLLKKGIFDTATVYVFKDASGEKAMACYASRSNAFESPDIPWDVLSKTKVLLVGGYLWNALPQHLGTVKRAVRFARSKGVKTALGLGNVALVSRNRGDMYAELETFDLIFGTEDEFIAFLHRGEAVSTDKLLKTAQRLGKLCIITLGEKGAYIVQSEKVFFIPSETVKKVVCTVGAGDAFAGAFLYGYTRQMGLEESGKLGAQIAAKIVQKLGTTLD